MAFLLSGAAVALAALVLYALLFTGRRARGLPDGM